MPMMWGYSYGWPMMFWMMLGEIFWLLLLGIAVWALVRWLSYRKPPTEPSAMEILHRRYARGEIDTATFEQMRERLEASETHDYTSERWPMGRRNN